MSMATLAVIGNPNAGKTTVFNDLTGTRQSTGNWPGVTVEKKQGRFQYKGNAFTLVDLPGTYSLDSEAPSLDEKVAREYILSHQADVLVNIIDASNLERSLYLTAQLLEMGTPLVLVLNMMDMAEKQGLSIDPVALEKATGCAVVTLTATRRNTIESLRAAIAVEIEAHALPLHRPEYEAQVDEALGEIAATLPESIPPSNRYWYALQLLSGHQPSQQEIAAAYELAREKQLEIEASQGEDIDLLIADGRYEMARKLATVAARRPDVLPEKYSDKIDQIVLNRWLSVPIFLLAMYLMFTFTINIGGAFIDFFDQSTGALLIDGFGGLLHSVNSPDWLTVLLANGIGGGIQVVATFIPIIAFLYFFLSLLEDSGYMARAAFAMDRLMRTLGLPGKAFVPLIVGFGCNVPAIMAARTLDVHRERIITVMMAPFMSCGARLSVYALFAAAFFPNGGQNVVFLLYSIGIVVAMLTAYLLKSTLLKGEPEDFLMELPTYQVPNLRGVMLHTWSKLRGFAADAGKVIVIMVMVINVLNSWGTDGSFGNEDSSSSMLSEVGRVMTPAFGPMGIEEDNWPATVGILTGVLAKEVVVGTLDTIYSQLEQPTTDTTGSAEPALMEKLVSALQTIPPNLSDALTSLGDPLGIGVVEDGRAEDDAAATLEVDTATFGAMVHRFNGQSGAFAYLLFILLYFPCVATTAAIKREAGWSWTLFAIVWTTGLAWFSATVYYQFANLSTHGTSAYLWLAVALAFFGAVYAGLRISCRNAPSQHAVARGQL